MFWAGPEWGPKMLGVWWTTVSVGSAQAACPAQLNNRSNAYTAGPAPLRCSHRPNIVVVPSPAKRKFIVAPPVRRPYEYFSGFLFTPSMFTNVIWSLVTLAKMKRLIINADD